MKTNRSNRFYHLAALMIGGLLLVAACGVWEATWDWMTAILLLAAAGLGGFTLGSAYRSATGRQEDIMIPLPQDKSWSSGNTSTKQTPPPPLSAESPFNLPDLLDELCRMQSSQDLLARYQSFTRLLEKVLDRALGPCNVSLWCPDQDHQNLIECVIRPGSRKRETPSTLTPSERVPCRIPLDVPPIREALQTGNPLLSPPPTLGSNTSRSKESGSLICNACIPLHREYGQPLLVNVEFTQNRVEHPRQRLYSIQAGFSIAVKLIQLFWKHLQATNQREWQIDHEPDSGILRQEAFLDQSQHLARQCLDQDDLFTVVVITIRGFRRMFAHEAHQWSKLTAVFGRSLKRILKQKNDNFLVGRMADDVFAVLLPRTDEFLTQSVLETLPHQLKGEILHDSAGAHLDMMALELEWSLADQKQYSGRIEHLLEKLYRRLFIRAANRQNRPHQIVLQEPSALPVTTDEP